MNRQGPFSGLMRLLPSVQGFMESVTDDFRNKRSVLIMLPGTMHASEIWPILRAYTASKEFHSAEVYSAELSNERPLADELCSALNVAWNMPVRPFSAEYFLKNVTDLPDIIYLDEYDELVPKRKIELLEFFKEWADASHICADQGRNLSSLCIMTSSPEILEIEPTTDTHLSLHFWCGIPSALEIKLLCRILSQDKKRSLWIESILPAIVGTDLSMADHLWLNYENEIDALKNNLINYSVLRQWDSETLSNLKIEDFEDRLEFQSDKRNIINSAFLKLLWIKGLIYWTPEYGLQMSTAVLASLGRERELQHRIWRGQIEYLLPLLDRIRLTLCEKLTNIYGASWPHQWEKPQYEDDYEAVLKDPMACPLGYLHYLLSSCVNMRRDRSLLPLVSQAKAVRNELAHYRPVEYKEYEKLLKEASIINERRL